MSQSIVGMRDPFFFECMEEVQAGLRNVFGTKILSHFPCPEPAARAWRPPSRTSLHQDRRRLFSRTGCLPTGKQKWLGDTGKCSPAGEEMGRRIQRGRGRSISRPREAPSGCLCSSGNFDRSVSGGKSYHHRRPKNRRDHHRGLRYLFGRNACPTGRERYRRGLQLFSKRP